ncbi:MAG: ferredoxin--NADP reductase [Myxococcota bacterium]|nr:ferredoxin--NADP(+) reductase [Myxococcales bacterium]MEC7750170.1 ferredoxin--NADP reductase [Myxococcota bacterium]
MAAVEHRVKVTLIEHYTESLFRFRVERPEYLKFRSGQFIMIGLEVEGKPIMRAYSITSPEWDEELEFYSIKIQDGPLTSRLQHIKVGDEILMSGRAVGNLLPFSIKPGPRLWLLSTGTGVAPYGAILRDEATYEKFDQIYLTHTCRKIPDLQYSQQLADWVKEDPLCGEYAEKQFHYYNSITRDPSHPRQGRITDLIRSGKLFEDLGVEPGFDPDRDRVMLCGSMEFNLELKEILEAAGLKQTNSKDVGEYVLEKAFVG